jgi:hypothetical protein
MLPKATKFMVSLQCWTRLEAISCWIGKLMVQVTYHRLDKEALLPIDLIIDKTKLAKLIKLVGVGSAQLNRRLEYFCDHQLRARSASQSLACNGSSVRRCFVLCEDSLLAMNKADPAEAEISTASI